MLTTIEIPGLYVQPDKSDLVCSLITSEASIIHDTPDSWL